MKKARLFAIHLLNDRSGSPLVMRQALDTLKEYYDITLYTSTPNGDGFLSDLSGVRTINIPYRRSRLKWLTLCSFVITQCVLFIQLYWRIKKSDTIYINTLLPFGAGLAGKCKRCKVIYHVHETSIQPKALRTFLVWVANRTATKVLFVSNYLAGQFTFAKAKTNVIHNCLPNYFTQQAGESMPSPPKAPFSIMMICSLKAYKGIYEFVELSRRLPDMRFTLIVNASQKEVDDFKKQTKPGNNCQVLPVQRNTFLYYTQCHLVLNLSRVNEWVETFGMTVLEGMFCARPVIVPPVGGVTELVKNGYNGYLLAGTEPDQMVAVIQRLANEPFEYKRLAQNAKQTAFRFSEMSFRNAIHESFDVEAPSSQFQNKEQNFHPVEKKPVINIQLNEFQHLRGWHN